jgi:uncharacterized membrane protein
MESHTKKRKKYSLLFVLQFSFFAALTSFPILIILRKYIFPIKPKILVYSIISGLSLIVYSFSLNKAYRHSDLSFTYPIVRSLPIILVVGFTLIFKLSKTLSLSSICGMTLICIGCFILPIKHWKDIKLKITLTPPVFSALRQLYAQLYIQ